MIATSFTTVSEEHIDADWPDSRHHIVTRVDGDLADKIRARSGRQGTVLIHETGEEGGYSEYTVEWEYDFRITVDGVQVFAVDYAGSDESGCKVSEYHWGNNGMAKLLAWLAEVQS